MNDAANQSTYDVMSPSMVEELQRKLNSTREHTNPVKYLKMNHGGRDFVVGDIHGAFNLVQSAMRKVGFNPDHDRLFACGDLIDRGVGSVRATSFLAQPYVHCVMGNHESNLLDLYTSIDKGDDDSIIGVLAAKNWQGMGWLLSTTVRQRIDLLLAIAKLPYVIEAQSSRGTIGLIHAEVPTGMDWGDFKAFIKSGDQTTIDFCLTSRERFQRSNEEFVSGVGRVFSGHTPQLQSGAKRMGNMVCVDTGAFLSPFPERYPKAGLCMMQSTFATEHVPDECEPQDGIHLILGHSLDPFPHRHVPEHAQ